MNRRNLFKTFGALIGAAPVVDAMPKVKSNSVVWPSCQQAEAVNSTARITVFCGKRSTGKTYAGLMWLMMPEHGEVAPIDNPEFYGLILVPNIRFVFNVASLFEKMFGGVYQRDLGGIHFASGAFVRVSPFSPYWHFQGRDYDRVFVDEAQWYRDLEMIHCLVRRHRTPGRVFLSVCNENRWTEWNDKARSYISVTLRYAVNEGYAKFVAA